MKKSIFILLAAALMLSSCAESVIEQIHPEMKGEGLLQIGLSVDENLQIVSTKASGLDESLVPSVEDLYVELYKYEVGKSGKGNSDVHGNISFQMHSNTILQFIIIPQSSAICKGKRHCGGDG